MADKPRDKQPKNPNESEGRQTKDSFNPKNRQPGYSGPSARDILAQSLDSLSPEDHLALGEHIDREILRSGKPDKSEGWDSLRSDQQEAYRDIVKDWPTGIPQPAAFFNWPREVQSSVRGSLSQSAKRLGLPDWIHGAGNTLPLWEGITTFFFVVGAWVGVTYQTWPLSVAILASVLCLVAFPLHWRAVYLREHKHDQDGATISMMLAVAACVLFGIPMLGIVFYHLHETMSGRSNPVTSANSLGLQRGTNGDLNAPLQMHWPVFYDRLPSGKIRATIWLYNNTGLPVSYATYGKLIVSHPASDDSSRRNILVPLRDEVDELVTNGAADHLEIMPHPTGRSQLVPDGRFQVVGANQVSSSDWNRVQGGELYIYLYAVVLLTYGETDISTSSRECAIQAGIYPMHCPRGFQEVRPQ